MVKTADAEIKEAGIELKYEVGTMIEIPRACLMADEMATEAEFFCFGTNDLTQMTYGFSRDDAGKFLNAYYEAKIFENDPFAKLDQNGVGQLMEMAVAKAKATGNNLHYVSAASTAATPSPLSSATRSAWTTSPALPSVCPSHVWLPHRLPSRAKGIEHLPKVRNLCCDL